MTRRVLLGVLGSASASHVLGCAASPAPAAPGRTHVAPPRPEITPPREPAPENAAAPPAAPIAEAPGHRRLRLPERPADAETGSAFFKRTESLEREAFEEAIYQAVASGNVPPFQRELCPIEIGDGPHHAHLYVLCDYLAIGSDQDFVRTPMTAATAQRIATLVDCVLPTTKLVDAIYRQAKARLPPSFIIGGPDLSDRQDYLFHNAELEAARAKRRHPLSALTAGDKKDIVLTNRLVEKSDRVAIYGWHRDDGTPIQPLSTLHGRRYADYSHGVRLIHQKVELDGKEQRLEDLLRHPTLAALLSDEGPLEIVSYPTSLPPRQTPKRTSSGPHKRKTARKSGN